MESFLVDIRRKIRVHIKKVFSGKKADSASKKGEKVAAQAARRRAVTVSGQRNNRRRTHVMLQ